MSKERKPSHSVMMLYMVHRDVLLPLFCCKWGYQDWELYLDSWNVQENYSYYHHQLGLCLSAPWLFVRVDFSIVDSVQRGKMIRAMVAEEIVFHIVFTIWTVERLLFHRNEYKKAGLCLTLWKKEILFHLLIILKGPVCRVLPNMAEINYTIENSLLCTQLKLREITFK